MQFFAKLLWTFCFCVPIRTVASTEPAANSAIQRDVEDYRQSVGVIKSQYKQ